ncbi:hypothetical protein JCM16303_000772 [Sporobolomyces ruberrimus]
MTTPGSLTITSDSQYTPVTGLCPISGTAYVLSGSATRLELASLNFDQSDKTRAPSRRWKVFERERIHRIVLDPAESGDHRRALVAGGKEAILVQLSLGGDSLRDVSLITLARFHLDDFAGDASFFSTNQVLISTLHNSVLVFSLPSSSHPDSSPPPLLRPIARCHAPARPLLWTSKFSQPRFGDEGEEASIRIAAGSLLGEVLVWDLPIATLNDVINRSRKIVEDVPTPDRIAGVLRRLNGHRGAIFTVAFCPTSPDLLASGSDDRSLRIWDLSPFSPANLRTKAADASDAERDVEAQARVLWGHEGRVWRIEWVDEKRLVSVGEDATCRSWQLNPSSAGSSPIPSTSTSKVDASAKDPAYTLSKTWRDGHDGRSIWSVAVAKITRSADEGQEGFIALTGGADGAIRSWALPPIQYSGAHIDRASLRKVDKGKQLKSFVVAVDPTTDQPWALSLTNDGSFYFSRPSTLVGDIESLHSSSAFANTATSLHLHFESASAVDGSTGATFFAFTNRGTLLTARLAITGALSGTPHVQVRDLSQHDIGHKTVSCTFDATRSKIAIWERATWRIHVSSFDPSSSSASPLTSLTTIKVQPSADGATAPTTCLFLEESFLLVGHASGQLSLYPLADDTNLLSSIDLHSDGVSDLRVISQSIKLRGCVKWEIESVGRDGMRRVTEIVQDGKTWTMRVVDERWIAKGVVEKVLVDQNGIVQYLALVDTRAGVFDSLGRLLYAFDSPAKQSLSQYVQTQTGGSHYYCVMQGILSHRSSTGAPSAIVAEGLHGREIRAVKMRGFSFEGEEVVIVATAAENGVLAISQRATLVIATAGDDNAVTVQRIGFSEHEDRLVASTSSARLAEAHGSTIQGLDFLSPTMFASSSVEQRLNIFTLDPSASAASVLLVHSLCLDAVDCSAQDANRIEGPGGERWRIVVAGIGIEVVEVLPREVAS